MPFYRTLQTINPIKNSSNKYKYSKRVNATGGAHKEQLKQVQVLQAGQCDRWGMIVEDGPLNLRKHN
jgi:hypothetical protein